MRPASIGLFVTIVFTSFLTVLAPGWARAQGVPGVEANKCLAKKNKCVSKKLSGLLRCREKCQKKPDSCGQVQADCEAKVRAKFDGGATPEKGCFAKLEAKQKPSKANSVCTTTGDTATMEARVDAQVAGIISALETVCTADVLVCPDSSVVSRDPSNACQFPACPAQCSQDLQDCGDNIFVGRDPANGCLFSDCPPFCTADVLLCPDGTLLTRERLNNCQFPPCP